MLETNLQKVYLLLGANLGNREETLQKAISLLNEQIGPVSKQSHLYETAPWGKTDQPGFLNLALELTSEKTAQELLSLTQSIESQLGRVRHEKWGARLIDIDILYFGELISNSDNLTLPHPFIQERRFVLVPLEEIAPEFIHPVFKKTTRELLISCPDSSEVTKVLH